MNIMMNIMLKATVNTMVATICTMLGATMLTMAGVSTRTMLNLMKHRRKMESTSPKTFLADKMTPGMECTMSPGGWGGNFLSKS